MNAQTIKCVFNRIGMPKLLGLVKFRLTNFLKDYLFYFNLFSHSGNNNYFSLEIDINC